MDALLHPDADGPRGAVGFTCLSFRHLPERAVPHVVIGDDLAGSWDKMAPRITTLSPGFWMELPGLGLAETSGLSARTLSGRIDRRDVAEYYHAYARRFVPAVARGRVLELRRANSSSVNAESCEADGGEWLVTYAGADGVRRQVTAGVAALATGMYQKPKKLLLLTTAASDGGAEILRRAPTHWQAGGGRVVVIGAGLSAADCVVAALEAGWTVFHVFRSAPEQTKIGSKFGRPHPFYPDYYRLSQLMTSAATDPLYTPFSRASLRSVTGRDCELVVEGGDSAVLSDVDRVVILIGSTPDLSFLRGDVAEALGSGETPVAAPQSATAKQATHPVYVDVDPFSMAVAGFENASSLFAWGPLRGDNFVRFLVGEAWPLVQKLNSLPSKSDDDGSCEGAAANTLVQLWNRREQSDADSYVFTLAQAMLQSHVLSGRVFVVGAAEREAGFLDAFEALPALLEATHPGCSPELRELHLVLVGPDLPAALHNTTRRSADGFVLSTWRRVFGLEAIAEFGKPHLVATNNIPAARRSFHSALALALRPGVPVWLSFFDRREAADTLRLFGPTESAAPTAASTYETDDHLQLFGLDASGANGARADSFAAPPLPTGAEVEVLWSPQPNAYHGRPSALADGEAVTLNPPNWFVMALQLRAME